MRSLLLLTLAILTGTALGVGCAVVTATKSEPVLVLVPSVELRISEHSVVHVYSSKGGGSGFPVGRDGESVIYMTSKHIVHDDAQVGVGFSDNMATSTWIERHPDLDMALVWCDLPAREVLELWPEPLEFGQHVRSQGWLMGEDLVVTGGYVGAGNMSAPIFFGMSGGPVFDDDDRVVGINDSTFLVRGRDGIEHPLPMGSDYIAISDAAPWLRSLGVIG